MAKIIFPCMSIEAHGKIAFGIIFATNQWGQYVKFVPHKRPTSTPAQRAVRHAYGQIATMWKLLTDEEQAAYHEKAVRNRRTECNQHFVEKWPEVYPP